jgi:hypothetical protein
MGMTWFLSTADRLCGQTRDRAETARAITSMILEGVGAGDA